MQSHRAVHSAIILCVAAFFIYLIVPAAQAEMIYDAEIKGTYEDNVVGLLSDNRGGYAGITSGQMAGGAAMMSKAMMMPNLSSGYTGSSSQSNSDTSLNLAADLGGSTKISYETSLFLIGSLQHTFYSTYTQFDYTIGGLSTGIYREFGDTLSGRLAINGSIKNYQDSQRNSSAYGATLSFKERFTPIFWLKENYDYEQNSANSAFFTYQGNAASIWAGFLVMPKTTILVGYNYLVRDYDQPSGFKVTANTISAGLEHELARKWYLDARYDRQVSNSNVPGTNTTDNIFSVGLRYSY